MEASLDNQACSGIHENTVAGSCRRAGAFVIDILILAVTGTLLALAFFDPLTGIGALGRGIGFIIALAYFGVLNSGIGGGQTVGKRLAGIKVVDGSGHLIGPARAHGRAAVLMLPYFLNMLQLPFLTMADSARMAMPVIQTAAVLGLGGGIIYLYFFNTRTRQSLHDLIFGTFVVTRDADHVAPKGGVLWAHKAFAACLFVFSLAGPLVLGVSLDPGQELNPLYQDLASTGRYTQITIHDTQQMSAKTPFAMLDVGVLLREEPGAWDTAADEVARLALAGFPGIRERDGLAVTVGRGADIGIGNISHNRTFHHSPEDWKQRLLMKSGQE